MNRQDTAFIGSHHNIEILPGCRVPLDSILLQKCFSGGDTAAKKHPAHGKGRYRMYAGIFCTVCLTN
jgi:hypothetical protein